MNTSTQSLDAINDIKKMMEKSSRFISLSGWSGITAGICGLTGAFAAKNALDNYYGNEQGALLCRCRNADIDIGNNSSCRFCLRFGRCIYFLLTCVAKEGTLTWGTTAKRLLWNTIIPMIVGGFLIIKLIDTGNYSFMSSCTLLFYGLALINGSKYTLGEIKYMGYAMLLLGIINLWLPDQWLLLWGAGFGAMHIICWLC